MHVGLLTGGGDCPGLNAVIRAVVRKIANAGGHCTGFLEGWRGLIEDKSEPLDATVTDGIIGLGGTILGSSRTNPFKKGDKSETIDKLLETFKKHDLSALVAMGGEDTLGVAHKLYTLYQLPVVGVPKTIDNDLSATDMTFGFDTALNIVMEAVDRLRTTADSHRRIMVVETMGRHAGWIACLSGMAVGADYILLPEVPVNIEHLCTTLVRQREAGKMHGIVIVSEGAQLPESGMVATRAEFDEFGHIRLGGIGEVLARIIEQQTKIETRSVILGHLQRGGPPSAADRVLATRYGIMAAELVLDQQWGTMAALKGQQVTAVPLGEAVTATKRQDLRYYQEAAEWFPGAYKGS
jgi:ATP-dependent phosphofructokinase / diphosphate-dependent phosphofructokinase